MLELTATDLISQRTVTPEAPVEDLDKILEIGEQSRNIVRGDSLDELATKLNTPDLEKTVAEYNTYAEKMRLLILQGLIHLTNK